MLSGSLNYVYPKPKGEVNLEDYENSFLKIKEFEDAFDKYLNNSAKKLLDSIEKEGEITDVIETKIKQVIDDFKKTTDFVVKEEKEEDKK